jgi:hypothetical protein
VGIAEVENAVARSSEAYQHPWSYSKSFIHFMGSRLYQKYPCFLISFSSQRQMGWW